MIPEQWQRRVDDRLAALDAASLRRRLHVAYDGTGPWRTIEGRRYLTFASNDYLGLAGDPRLARALAHAADHWGVGSGAAQLLGGYTAAHRGLEERLAEWTGQPRALLFPTGYQANLGLVGALVERGDLVIEDKLNHASLIDAAQLSGAAFKRYLHRDVEGLERRLSAAAEQCCLVATDSVFSMDGDLAPLPELRAVTHRHGALFAVDDAHALGVLGPAGAGAPAAAGIRADLVMATLGKAVGCAGAFVAGNADLIELILQRARSYIYTTAPPPALAATALVAVELARSEEWRREKLAELIARLREGAGRIGVELLHSDTPIQPLVLRSAERALAVSMRLREQGLWVPAVRPPTVPASSARLRITLTAAHETADIDRLLEALAAALAASDT